MKKKNIMFLIIIISVNILVANNRLSDRSMGTSNIEDAKFDKYGSMLGFAPTDKGFSVQVYGIPQRREFKPTLSYFSFYIERKGKFSGGEFDDPPLEFWVKEDKEIYRKYIMNLGSTHALLPNKMLILAYFAGIGFYEEFEQYRSRYGNDWFINNENKVIGDVGIELIGRISVINLGIGISYQSLYFFSAGFEF